MLLCIELFAFLILVIPMNVLSSERVSFLSKFCEPILLYISTNSNRSYQITEYKAVFNKMNQNDFYSACAIRLGYLVTKLQKLYPDNSDLKLIIRNLPSGIVNIPWGTPVYIYNIATNQFLCAGDEPLFDNFLYYKTYSSFDRTKICFWIFSIETSGQHFTIRNNANKRYLVAAPNPLDMDKQRPIVSTVDYKTNITGISNAWQFQPYHEGRNHPIQYHIKNYLWDEYVCAHDVPGEHNKRLRNNDTNLCLWRLLKQSEPLPLERENFLSNLYAQYTGDSKTAEILLQHASQSDSKTRVTEYTTLFGLMKKYDGFYSVAGMILDYNIEQLLKQYPNDFELLEIEKYFRKLWTPFPWNRPVTIQNKGDRKYVCMPDLDTSEPRMRERNETCYWQFEIDSSGFYFRIKTLLQNRYLEAKSKGIKFWEKRLIIASSKTPDKEIDRWQLSHEREEYYDVIITNVFHNEALYSYTKTKTPRPTTVTESISNCLLCRWVVEEAKLGTGIK